MNFGLFRKTLVFNFDYFLATFGENWAIFIFTSGATGRSRSNVVRDVVDQIESHSRKRKGTYYYYYLLGRCRFHIMTNDFMFLIE